MMEARKSRDYIDNHFRRMISRINVRGKEGIFRIRGSLSEYRRKNDRRANKETPFAEWNPARREGGRSLSTHFFPSQNLSRSSAAESAEKLLSSKTRIFTVEFAQRTFVTVPKEPVLGQSIEGISSYRATS
jgi:hypothetical protein